MSIRDPKKHGSIKKREMILDLISKNGPIYALDLEIQMSLQPNDMQVFYRCMGELVQKGVISVCLENNQPKYYFSTNPVRNIEMSGAECRVLEFLLNTPNKDEINHSGDVCGFFKDTHFTEQTIKGALYSLRKRNYLNRDFKITPHGMRALGLRV